MRTILLMFLFLSLISPIATSAASSEEIIMRWLEKIAGGIHDLNQPFFPSPEVSHDYVFSFPEMKDPKEDHFLAFLQATEGTMDSWFRASGDETSTDRGFPFDSKVVRREIISRVLGRRTPIINSFDFDKTKYNGDNPRYVCRSTMGSHYDYLGFVQIRLLIILFSSKDLRFQPEAEALLHYIKNPPKSDDWLERPEESAFLCYTGDSRIDLRLFLKTYIKACKGGKSKRDQ